MPIKMTEVEQVNKLYRMYIIKCEVTGKCYVGYTDSTNEKYNPLSYLYNQYKRSENKYVNLGESIKVHKYGKHKYTFVKSGLTKEQAKETSEKFKEKLGDRCLNDVQKVDFFKDEIDILEELEKLSDHICE